MTNDNIKIHRETKRGSVVYTLGNVKAILAESHGGRRTYGYGHWGHEYNQVLYLTKGEDRIYVKSHKNVYIGYVKALMVALTQEPTECPYCHRMSYFYGKKWQKYPHTELTMRCEKCERPKYEWASYGRAKDNDLEDWSQAKNWVNIDGYVGSRR